MYPEYLKMTLYRSQVQYLQKNLFPKDYLLIQIIRSKKFIDNNYANNINLGDIAGEAFFSKFHFIRLFKKYYGVTPYQYLIRVRVAGAKKLLQSGMSISDACYGVGFESVPSFTKLFKAITGTTPLACQLKAVRKSNFE
ncbi:MAG: AraC family transcriptional regulator [Mucilaginibacter sp.]|nr:AraC family transcriptional regulator [Mucilaginibacter sp.]